MSAKLQCLVVATLALAPLCATLANNDGSIKDMAASFKLLKVDPLTANDVVDAFKEALQEEEPLLEEEKKTGHRNSLLRTKTNLRASKGKAVAAAPISIKSALHELSGPADGSKSDFEQDITDLLMGLSSSGMAGSSDGTPGMGSAVEKIKDIITNDMMPKVINASEQDKATMAELHAAVVECGTTKTDALNLAQVHHNYYLGNSTAHKACRLVEEAAYDDNKQCHSDWRAMKEDMELKCTAFADHEKKYTDETTNLAIVGLQNGEDAEMYVQRVTSSVCGESFDCTKCGTDEEPTERANWHGFLDTLLFHKTECENAQNAYNAQTLLCQQRDRTYHLNRSNCDTEQDVRDQEACTWATKTNEACQQYITCYNADAEAFEGFAGEPDGVGRQQEIDRKAEWHGLSRMRCIIEAFAAEGGITMDAIDKCRVPEDHGLPAYTTTHLDITWLTIGSGTTVDDREACVADPLYPNTGTWKEMELDTLPENAQGKADANDCVAMLSIPTEPNPASKPAGCECKRVTLDGPFSPGPIVKCTGCTDVSRSQQTNSCPDTTKLFAPRSHQDWETFLVSADPKTVRSPNFIIDITRPLDGCGTGEMCANETEAHAMNTLTQQENVAVRADRWVTTDESHWWLRETSFTAPTANYQANCYLDLTGTIDEAGEWVKPHADSITFANDACNYHSKSYYCQLIDLDLKPKAGSPASCSCKRVEISEEHTPLHAGVLIMCQKCLDVYKSQDKNSCPPGTKIFSPATREDWVTFLASASVLRDPHFIIDIIKDTDGCSASNTCNATMKSDNPSQATWHTSDGSPWWLRDTEYSQPNGDYTANCYMDLMPSGDKPTTEEAIQFDDDSCLSHSRSYYCQPVHEPTETETAGR